MPKPVETIKSRELWVITQNASRNKEGAGFKLRVVQYYKPAAGAEPAKSISVKLESGEYFRGDDGIERMKTKGLSPRDVKELLKTHVEKKMRIIQVVEALQDSPPPLPVEAVIDPLDKPNEDEAQF